MKIVLLNNAIFEPGDLYLIKRSGHLLREGGTWKNYIDKAVLF